MDQTRYFIPSTEWKDAKDNPVPIWTLAEILKDTDDCFDPGEKFVEIKVVGERTLTITRELK